MPGPIFVTGGSGFVGTAVIEELLSRGYAVNALVNRRPIARFGERVRSIRGGVFDDAALLDGIRGCDAVIHLVGIIVERPSNGITFQSMHVEATRHVIDATRRAGVKRYLHMSALGTRPDAVSTYHKTKFAAEEIVRSSGLAWTIFRPSMIHGAEGEFVRMESRWARHVAPPFLFMPYFGAGLFGRGGAGMLQPVYVGDVARAFVDAIENPKTIGEIFPIAGPDQLSWPDLHRAFAEAILGRRRAVMALPAWYARLLTHVVPAGLLPFNRDQVIMSQEDNTTDLTKFTDAFGWTAKPFVPTLRDYASKIPR